MSTLEMRRSAIISECKTYRYRLERMWEENGRVLAFLMLNPSTADDKKDDPTLKRCIHFAKSWGFGGLIVGNLYALRSSTPFELFRHDSVGPDNDWHLKQIAEDAHQTVIAWGATAWARDREEAVLQLPWKNLCALAYSKDGHPRHPLARGKHRIPNDAQALPYPMEMDCI